MSRDSFMCETWVICVRDMSHLCVRNDSFVCVSWLICVCVMTHLCVWHDSFVCVIHASFMCVTWVIYVCDMSHLCVWHESFVCVVTHDSVPLSPGMCDRTYVCEWHDQCSSNIESRALYFFCQIRLVCAYVWVGGFVGVGECSCDIESRALDPEPMTQYHNCVRHALFSAKEPYN